MYTKSIDKENKYYIFIYSQNKTMLPFIMYRTLLNYSVLIYMYSFTFFRFKVEDEDNSIGHNMCSLSQILQGEQT